MNDAPDVAVIVPAFNAGATIAGALASVAAQHTEPREVIVVDDCSSDATAEVANEWKAMLPLTTIRLERNGGPARARNEGVRRTSGALLAFLDADDLWLPNHLDLCLDLQRRTGGVVAGRGVRWTHGSDLADAGVEGLDAGPPPDASLEWIVRHHSFGMHAIVPRKVFDDVGGFDASLDGAEDWDFWIRVAQRGVPMHRTSSRTFIYRQHEHNLSQQMERHAAAAFRVLDRLERDPVANSPGLRAAIRDSRALVAYAQASAELDAQHYAAARRSAISALRGPWSLSARAAAIAVAPRGFARLRELRRTGAGAE